MGREVDDPAGVAGVGRDVSAAHRAFERFAGGAAILTALGGLAYALCFVVLANTLLASLFLTLAALASTPVLLAVYHRLRLVEPAFSAWAVLLGLAGALGSMVHGGFDLANAIHPQGPVGDLPNAVDPRGLLTFGVGGIGLFAIGWLVMRSGVLPRRLGTLGCVTGVLLVALYLGRLIILDPANPLILIPAALTGFLASPALYAWLGAVLLRR